MRVQGYSYPGTFRKKQIDAIVGGRKDISGVNDEATLWGVTAVIVQDYPDRQTIAPGYALNFSYKLAGCDFDKSLNTMVLQKCAPAKSHEKTWELAGRFSVVKPCNYLIFNEYAEKQRRGFPANLFGFLVLGYAHMVAPQPEYTTSGCYEIGGPGGSARRPSSRRLVALF